MLALLARSTSATPVLEDVARPALGPGDVRIQVAAAAINPVDVAVVSGPLRDVVGLPDPFGLGWDVSGTVLEVGRDVTGLRPGDRVAGVLYLFAGRPAVGAQAVETVVPAESVARVPDDLDLVDAASLPLNALSARKALGLLGPAGGRTLLITGAAGAVGGHALVLAQRAGWRVTGLARESDADFVARTGAEPVTELPGTSFDAVLDAAVLLGEALGAVRDGGAFVSVAPASPVAPVRGISIRTLGVDTENGGPESEAIGELLELAADGTLEVRVAGRAPLAEAAAAYGRVAGGGQRGRWLLLP